MGRTPPPTRMKKQKARPPPVFNLSLGCPGCPRGVGHGASAGPRWGGARARSGGSLLPSSQLASIIWPRKRTQDTGNGGGMGLSTQPPPPPPGPVLSPRRRTARPSRAGCRAGEGKEGRREGRVRCPPRGPRTTCLPPPTAAPSAPRAAAGAALSARFAPRCP